MYMYSQHNILKPSTVHVTLTPTLQIIYQFWVSTPAHTLWQSDSSLLYYVLVVVHIASWISIACSVFTIDYLELLGIKQVSPPLEVARVFSQRAP